MLPVYFPSSLTFGFFRHFHWASGLGKHLSLSHRGRALLKPPGQNLPRCLLAHPRAQWHRSYWIVLCRAHQSFIWPTFWGLSTPGGNWKMFWNCPPMSNAGFHLSSNPFLVVTPQPHLLKSGPLETRNKSKSWRQTFEPGNLTGRTRADLSWASFSVAGWRNRFETCKMCNPPDLTPFLAIPAYSYNWESPSLTSQSGPVSCEKLEKLLAAPGRTERTKFCVLVDLLQ